MPLQNRVDPFGELFADPARGLFMGNRGGRFHTDDRTLTHAALGVAAMDLLPARIQGSPARRLGQLLHRAVLPRRGDRARRRPPALLRVPAQGRRSFRRAGERAFSLRHGRARPRWTPCCTPNGSTAAPSACIGCRSTICRMARSSRCDGRARFAVRGARCCDGRPGLRRAQARAARDPVDVLTPPAILAALAAGYQPQWHPSADR